mgnify:CR=1 FL=1
MAAIQTILCPVDFSKATERQDPKVRWQLYITPQDIE